MAQLVINEGALFAVLSPSGECTGADALGLFARDTRYLSSYRVGIGDGDEDLKVLKAAPLAPFAYRVFMANRGSTAAGRPRMAHSLGVDRTLVADGHAFVDEARLTNYGHEPVEFEWRVQLGADFKDIMVVRNHAPGPEGKSEEPRPEGRRWVLGYRGAGGMERCLVVAASQDAVARAEGAGRLSLSWKLNLGPGQSRRVVVWLAPHEGTKAPLPEPPGPLEGLAGRAMEELSGSYRAWDSAMAGIEVQDESLRRLLVRGREDLRALVADFGDGPFPVAGIPWFAAPFGRDSLWAAYFVLPFAPHLARGVLLTLARYQADRSDDWTDAEPGKILHELRFGEAARLGLIPHRPYYGTVDATPLFAALAADYTLTTGDRQTFATIEDAVWKAVEWMERYGDLDGDGFIEYRRRSWAGLDNQGWKDSWDSVWHADGQLARPPVALVEVQAYAYQAYRSLATLTRRLGRAGQADALQEKASQLAERFDRSFWLEDQGFYAHALDADKRPVAAITSNPGHALWGGIVPKRRAPGVAAHLTGPALFSGYGVRTAAAGQIRFNPMSYHNGSVWPHDTAIAAAGLSRYGFVQEAARVVRGLLDASAHFEGSRLPELFCGFGPEEGPPVPYPTACSPQAWAAAAPFLVVAALTGLEVDGLSGQVRTGGRLPGWLGEVRFDNLPVGEGRASLRIRPLGETDAKEAGQLVPARAEISGPASLLAAESR
ncbi:MAG: glycogen debranching N-terminal domain-containing protein [Bacillota bacterium]